MQLAKQTGWIVRDFEIDDGCSEIENRDGMGREIEVKLDLPTLQVVETDYLDEVGPLFYLYKGSCAVCRMTITITRRLNGRL